MSSWRARYGKAGGVGISFAVLSLACVQTFGASQKRVQAKKAAPATFGGDVRPLLTKYCVSCHGGKEPTAGLDLSKFATPDSVVDDGTTWSKVLDRLSNGQMPPSGMPQPTAAEKSRALDWVQMALQNQCKLADPGRVTIRRLNRQEYDNTIRDLTGLSIHASDDFPSDDVGYGFDNIGDVLSISPLLMEKYLNSAENIAHQIIQTPDSKPVHISAAELSDAANSTVLDEGWREYFSSGESSKTLDLPQGGKFRLKIVAAADLAGPEQPKMEVSVDGKPVANFDVDVKFPNYSGFTAPVEIDAGKHTIGVKFTNDYYNTSDPPGKQDRNLYVDYLELAGPEGAKTPLTPAYQRVVPEQPTPATMEHVAKLDLRNFASKAYREPVSDEELGRLMKLFDLGKSGGGFNEGMQVAIEGVLCSPNFLFRVELDPKATAGKVRALTDYELASRLSYFLWSSMPDDELMTLAKEGKLHSEAVLNQQVKRMLADPKSKALADDFAGQWLQLRKLAIVEPNRRQFPSVNGAMKKDMETETKMFFTSVLQNNRPITDFIDADYTYVNGPLAKLYGMTGVEGGDFRRVKVAEPRGGVLAQASVLLVTSNPTRTSPTKRGKWVLEQILGTPPPPPPPGVGVINDEQHKIKAATVRQLMEEHRKNPMCAACHAKMDPLGFGLENFDAVGQWRTTDHDAPIDCSGVLPNGQKFDGPAELKQILLQRKDLFARALTEKLLTYGLGRGVESADRCAIDGIVKQSSKNGYRFASLITAVVDSDPFRKRKGELTK
ncbi:MAG TPA: DUF1592 domain-containing protein [Fimbriimonas sp.]|nr:DUF1592 domain-containing protein [Fimbriimonas sp.]